MNIIQNTEGTQKYMIKNVSLLYPCPLFLPKSALVTVSSEFFQN